MQKFVYYAVKLLAYLAADTKAAINSAIEFVDRLKSYQPEAQEDAILFDANEIADTVFVAANFGYKFAPAKEGSEMQQAGEWLAKQNALRKAAFFLKLAAYRAQVLGCEELPTAILEALISLVYHARKAK